MDELPQNISSKMFCWSSISKRDEIMSSFRQMHRIKEIRVDMPVPTTSLSSYFFDCHLLIYHCNTNCLEPVQDQWIPKALFSYFSKKTFAVGTHWKRLDSFTLSRLMKRPKTCCDPARDEYPQLTFFFVKYTENVSTMFKPIRRRIPTLFKCCSLIFDRITC